MKKSSLLLVLLCFCLMNITQAQNVFPSSGNVGIGTTTPAYPLDINGTIQASGGFYINRPSYTKTIIITTNLFQTGPSTLMLMGDNFEFRDRSNNTKMAILNNGNILIGTQQDDGQNKLQVNGGITTYQLQLIYNQINNSPNAQWGEIAINYSGKANAPVNFYNGSGVSKALINPNGSSYFIGGNIGIGTTNPQSLLSVNGTITGKQVTVINTGWSDFVFDSAYHLPSLSKTETFINANHHLPGIPSTKQIESKGLNLGEMEKKQMQKIEELTLYQINADKKIKQLHAALDEYKNELSEMKMEIKQLQNALK